MGRTRIFLAIFAALFTMSAAAQTLDTVKVSFGYQINDNRNLRFTQAEKVHTEVALGGHASMGGYTSWGADLMATRVYTPAKAFGWRWGGMASMDYANHYGATSDVLAVLGVRFGNKVYLGVDALAGAGQLSYYDHAWSGENTHDYYSSLWRVKAGAQLSLGVRLGSKVSLSIYGRYLHAFNSSDSRTMVLPEGWEASPTEWHSDRLAAGLALTFNINHETRLSGDNCWQAGVYGGYSFLGNEGWVAGAELLHFKRSAARGGAVYGVGSYQVFGTEVSTNTFYGQAGYRVLPWGSSSVLEFEFGVKAGLGEYAKTECGSTENGEFRMSTSSYSMGVQAKAYVGVSLHFGRHQIKIAGDFGGHYNFGAAFTGEADYNGTASNGFGSDAIVTVGYAFSF